jgi:hypothetical protein
MAIFQVINTADHTDTEYDGFVKDAANWSVAEGALSAANTKILVGGGVGSAPVFTTATGTGSPVRATSPTLVTPNLGTPASGDLSNCTGVGLWSPINDFTATPASTSTIIMTADLTATIPVGSGLKYVYNSVTYYGQITALATNLMTIRGAPLNLAYPVTSLRYGGNLRQAMIVIPGLYEDATNTALITSDLSSSWIWKLPRSYLVGYDVYSKVHDTGTHGQASVTLAGNEVNTTAGGLTIAADATWYSTVVDINATNYVVSRGDALSITCVKNGNGDAQTLTVLLTFVTP